jgi:hypothetical protein
MNQAPVTNRHLRCLWAKERTRIVLIYRFMSKMGFCVKWQYSKGLSPMKARREIVNLAGA